MQILRSHPRPAELESVFEQDAQVASVLMTVSEALLYDTAHPLGKQDISPWRLPSLCSWPPGKRGTWPVLFEDYCV